jgi:hypothetical protein
MKHLVLIRFNAGISRYKRPKVGWLEHRLKFFRAFTAPSLRAQTNNQFTTVFLVDPTTPNDIVQELSGIGLVYITDHSQRISVRTHEFRMFLSSNIGPERCVVTSRLDSDDGFSRNYIEKTQRSIRQDTRNDFMIYNNGVVWTDNKFFLKTDEAAPFLSRVEWRDRTPAPPDTVFCVRTHVDALALRHQAFNEEPMWLMACHDKNLLNTPGELGRELSLEEVNQYFEVDLSWLE